MSHLFVDYVDGGRLNPHTQSHTDVEQLVEEEGLDSTTDKEQGCKHIPLPHRRALIFCEVNHLTAIQHALDC